jgi:hypothetical protein
LITNLAEKPELQLRIIRASEQMNISAKYGRPRQRATMRTKALSIALKRKEEFLGARVPRELKEKVLARAALLGIPVSILIRKILEGAFSEGDADGLLAGTDIAARDGQSAPGNTPVGRFPTVLGWEKIKLNRRIACAGCGENIDSGTFATLGLSIRGDEHIILCDVCSESL